MPTQHAHTPTACTPAEDKSTKTSTAQASPLLEDEEVDGEDVQDRENARKRPRGGGGCFGRREGDAALRHGLENLLANPQRLRVALAIGRDGDTHAGWKKRGSEGGER